MESMESRESLHTEPLQAWREESQRHEQATQELREEYRNVLQPVLDITESVPPKFDDTWGNHEIDEYFENLRHSTAKATGEVLPRLVPGPEQIGVKPQELHSFFTEIADAPTEAVSSALVELINSGKLHMDEQRRITRSIPE